MPIPALIIDAELLPPPSCHRTLNDHLAPLKADAFKHRFGGCACALFVARGSASGQVVDLVADLRRRAPLVPLAVLTDVSLQAPRLFRRLAPDAIVTAPTTADVLLKALDSIENRPVLERLAGAIERGGYFEPSIGTAAVKCCRSEEPVHTVGRMVELSRLKEPAFRSRWGDKAVNPQELLHTLELIRAATLWENGVRVKHLPGRLGIGKSTLERRRAGRRFRKGLAHQLARERKITT